ncbi:MAG: Nudix family hydrolase [Gammaproteobacteria bacterium]
MSGSTLNIEPEVTHVAVACVINSEGEVLVSRRPEGVHLEGLWEFPGGKLEKGESVFAALQRELKEEVGIQVESARQLIKITHDYPEKTVKLDTWLINEWSGDAAGLEGQEIKWLDQKELIEYQFPEADLPIMTALSLPSVYQISPEPGQNIEGFLNKVEVCLADGVKLFQLRAKESSSEEIDQISKNLKMLCEKYQAKWLINGEPKDVLKYSADGVHITSKRLLSMKERPLNTDFLMGASCHNLEELTHADKLDLDFAVLAPVKKTLSHPEVKPLGFDQFEELIEKINIPVYALGGLSITDLETAWEHGAQGVAMIRAGWD